MAIIPWKPFRDMDEFFGDDDIFSLVPRSSLKEPSIDLYETEKDVVAEFSVPGFDPNDIEISVEKDHIRVKGSVEEKEEKKEKGYWRKEIRKGSFDRTLHLPAEVNEDKVDATYDSGMLKVVMPKLEKKKSKGKNVKIRKKGKS